MRKPRLGRRERNRRQFIRRRSKPFWYDSDNKKECGHDVGGTSIHSHTGYSDFTYLKYKCDKKGCEETYCGYIEG